MSSPLNRNLGFACARSVIDAWLSIVGNLKTEGEIVAEGQILGDVRCIHLVVGVDAGITGNIVADEVIVRGKVKGSIRANRVVLEATAVVDADIFHRSLLVKRGACFDGSSRRRDQPLAAELDKGIAGLKSAAQILRHLDARKVKQIAGRVREVA